MSKNEDSASSDSFFDTSATEAVIMDLEKEVEETSDKQIEELQTQLEREKDAHKEDVFVCIVVIIMLFDIMIFSVMETSGGPIAILLLQLMILVPLAGRMGVDRIKEMLDGLLTRASSHLKGDD